MKIAVKDRITLALSLLILAACLFGLADGVDNDCDGDLASQVYQTGEAIVAVVKSRLVPS